MVRALLLTFLIGWGHLATGTNPPVSGQPGILFLTDEASARQQARAEGKWVFIEFYASWCLPCRWMNASTFQDPEVAELMQAHFVPVRADVDRAEGFRLFGAYNVTVLPTLIILDEEGRVVAREEESLTIVQMLDMLREHQPDATADARRNLPAAPAYTTSTAPEPVLMKAAPPVAEAPAVTIEPTASLPEVPETGFSVQVGVYTQYANVLSRGEEMRAIGEVPVFVETRSVEQSTIYKLLSGHFATRQEAESWRATLAAAQVPGYIRDLSR